MKKERTRRVEKKRNNERKRNMQIQEERLDNDKNKVVENNGNEKGKKKRVGGEANEPRSNKGDIKWENLKNRFTFQSSLCKIY